MQVLFLKKYNFVNIHMIYVLTLNQKGFNPYIYWAEAIINLHKSAIFLFCFYYYTLLYADYIFYS